MREKERERGNPKEIFKIKNKKLKKLSVVMLV